MAIQDFYEELAVMKETTIRDEFGGTSIEWIEDFRFLGAYAIDNSSQYILADNLANKANIKITCNSFVDIAFGTIIKRLKNGVCVKVLSDAHDYDAPTKASYTKDLAMYSCEKVVSL